MLKATVDVDPFAVRVANEREAIDAGGVFLAGLVRRRAQSSRGPDGPLPRNHQGTPPWVRTGRLAGSIGHILRQDKRGWRAIIRPLGALSDRDVGAIRARAKAKTKQLRAAAALGAPLVQRGASGKFQRRPGAPRPRKIQVRPVDTYAALAAVLSVPDKRRSSKRPVYRVVIASQGEAALAHRVVKAAVKMELTEAKK